MILCRSVVLGSAIKKNQATKTQTVIRSDQIDTEKHDTPNRQQQINKKTKYPKTINKTQPWHHTPKKASPIPKALGQPSFSLGMIVLRRAKIGPSSCNKIEAVDTSMPLNP